jgi:hypothetical protein
MISLTCSGFMPIVTCASLLPAGAGTPFGGCAAAVLSEGAAVDDSLPLLLVVLPLVLVLLPPDAHATSPISSALEPRERILRNHDRIETPGEMWRAV